MSNEFEGFDTVPTLTFGESEDAGENAGGSVRQRGGASFGFCSGPGGRPLRGRAEDGGGVQQQD